MACYYWDGAVNACWLNKSVVHVQFVHQLHMVANCAASFKLGLILCKLVAPASDACHCLVMALQCT